MKQGGAVHRVDIRGRPRSGTPRSWLDSVLRHRIHVHTKDDHTIEGVLECTTPDGLVLRAPVLHSSDAERGVPMAGEVFVPRDRISFIQDTTSIERGSE